jgi:hypothetical protein
VFLETFTELSYAKSLSQADPRETSIKLLEAKDRCYSLVKEARNSQEKSSDGTQKVSSADLDLLVKHANPDATISSDPLCLFLVGALVWWHLVDRFQCTDRFGLVDGGKFGSTASLVILLIV